MKHTIPIARRRPWLKHCALASLALLIHTPTAAQPAAAAPPGGAAAPVPPEKNRPRGQPGEFNFLNGQWRIANRRRLPDGRWDEYPGEASCWSILGGVISIEELRIPARNFSGMGLRALDLEKGVWCDYWVNARSGVLGEAGLVGGFEGGVGRFDAEAQDNGRTVLHRGQWDLITANSCRWQQMTSHDRGVTWDVNWSMAWTRA